MHDHGAFQFGFGLVGFERPAQVAQRVGRRVERIGSSRCGSRVLVALVDHRGLFALRLLAGLRVVDAFDPDRDVGFDDLAAF